MADLQAQVEELWERRAELAVADGDALPVVREAIGLLDRSNVAAPNLLPLHGAEG